MQPSAAAATPLEPQPEGESRLLFSSNNRSIVGVGSIFGCPDVGASHFPYAAAPHWWQSDHYGALIIERMRGGPERRNSA